MSDFRCIPDIFRLPARCHVSQHPDFKICLYHTKKRVVVPIQSIKVMCRLLKNMIFRIPKLRRLMSVDWKKDAIGKDKSANIRTAIFSFPKSDRWWYRLWFCEVVLHFLCVCRSKPSVGMILSHELNMEFINVLLCFIIKVAHLNSTLYSNDNS